MIKFTGVDLLCDCGNTEGNNFHKYVHKSVVIGERQRKSYIEHQDIICAKCQDVLTEEELQIQVAELKLKYAKKEGVEA